MEKEIEMTSREACAYIYLEDNGDDVYKITMNHFDTEWIKNHLFRVFKLKKRDLWANFIIERVLLLHKVYDIDSWDVSIVRGYYGKEVNSASLKDGQEVIKEIEKLLAMKKESDIVRYLLEKEYGFVLYCLEDSTYTIEKIDVSGVIFGKDSYFRKIDNSHYCDGVENFGLVIKNNDRTYRLIDGYHRMAKAKRENFKKVFVVVATPKARIVLDGIN